MDPLLLGLVVLPAVVTTVLWRVGAFADPYSRAWQSIAGTRAIRGGFRGSRRRVTVWLAERLDLPRQLRRAGIRMSPGMFLARCGLDALLVMGATLLLDAALVARSGTAPVAPWLGVVGGAAIAGLRVTGVPRRARLRREAIDDAMTELMVPLVIVSASGAIANRKEAILLFSRALDDPTLARFLQIPEAFGEARDETALDYRSLVSAAGALDDVSLFRAIGEAYGTELFAALSQAEYQVRRSRSLRDALRGVADQYLSRQLAEDEQWMEGARTRVTVPMSAFVLLVFAAILVPTVSIIVGAIGG